MSYDSPLEYAGIDRIAVGRAGGLTDFTVEEGPDEFKWGRGVPAVSLTYTYQAGNGEKQREARLLALSVTDEPSASRSVIVFRLLTALVPYLIRSGRMAVVDLRKSLPYISP